MLQSVSSPLDIVTAPSFPQFNTNHWRLGGDDDDDNFTPGDMNSIWGYLFLIEFFLQCRSFHLIAHAKSSKSPVRANLMVARTISISGVQGFSSTVPLPSLFCAWDLPPKKKERSPHMPAALFIISLR